MDAEFNLGLTKSKLLEADSKNKKTLKKPSRYKKSCDRFILLLGLERDGSLSVLFFDGFRVWPIPALIRAVFAMANEIGSTSDAKTQEMKIINNCCDEIKVTDRRLHVPSPRIPARASVINNEEYSASASSAIESSMLIVLFRLPEVSRSTSPSAINKKNTPDTARAQVV